MVIDEEFVVRATDDLGAALKYFRTRKGVTQREAAEMEGVGQPYLSALEGGKFSSSLRHVLRLLRLLDCEVVIRPRGSHG